MDRPEDDAPTIDSRDKARTPEDAATLDSRTLARPSAPGMPAAIGRYRIIGRLGEGGMGIVFEAEQEMPRRRVALKVIRGGTFVDEQAVKLFQREAETLARLKHPNIAGIYEAGRTDSGQHFFAMELVRGRNLNEYLAARPGPLDTRELRFRLRLFQMLCDAVNYAHQRGVIHRDLKPSNIVVSDAEHSGSDGMPDVKILDFGLARITGSDVEAMTAVSEIGVIKGTLPYMSPEQARGNPDDIDLRSDVYALGVILFEMLTGQRPYDVQKVSLMESVRIICEQPPSSLRSLWKSGARPDADLETIAGKALEKEAERRYPSAAALGDDVGRYLESRPILARAPSTMYQLGKFARRNRTLVAGAAATLVVLVAGIIVSTMFGIREATQRRAAEAARKDTEAVVDFQSGMLNEIDPARMGQGLADDLAARLAAGRTERGATPAEVNAALTSFRSYLGEINTTDAALQVIDTNILEHAVQAARSQFATRPLVRAQLMRSIGDTYFKLGLYDKSEPALLASRAIYDSLLGPNSLQGMATLRSLGGLYAYQSRLPEAESLFVRVLTERQARLGLHNEETIGGMSDLALLYTDMGRFSEAESLNAIALREHRALKGEMDRFTLTIMANYSWALTQDHKFAAAESLGKLALERRRKVLGNDDAETMMSVNNMGVLYRNMGRDDIAVKLYEEDYATTRRRLGDEHPDLIASMCNLGRLYSDMGRYAEAEALLRKGVSTAHKVMPPGFFGTGVTLLAYSDALIGLKRYAEAEPALLEGRKILFDLAGPGDGGVQHADGALVQVYEHTGRAAQAAVLRAKLAAKP